MCFRGDLGLFSNTQLIPGELLRWEPSFCLLPAHPFRKCSCDRGLGWERLLAAMEKSIPSGSLGGLQAVLLMTDPHLWEQNYTIP